MAMSYNQETAHLKLHILSEGVSFDAEFLEHFANDLSHMEKRRAYNDSDERQLEREKRMIAPLSTR